MFLFHYLVCTCSFNLFPFFNVSFVDMYNTLFCVFTLCTIVYYKIFHLRSALFVVLSFVFCYNLYDVIYVVITCEIICSSTLYFTTNLFAIVRKRV